MAPIPWHPSDCYSGCTNHETPRSKVRSIQQGETPIDSRQTTAGVSRSAIQPRRSPRPGNRARTVVSVVLVIVSAAVWSSADQDGEPVTNGTPVTRAQDVATPRILPSTEASNQPGPDVGTTATPPIETAAPDPRRRKVVGGMTPASWALSGVFAAGGFLILAEGSRDDAERLGDALQLVLPASAYSMTWIARDGRGAAQYSIQLGAGLATTYGLKHAVTKRTPTAADFDSFPSAHTQAAFSGASFIHRRFGPRWGVPAYGVAAYTGLSRVKADRHYLDDVIAGMSIALMAAIGPW